jgi:predicted alpha/beta-hydrolase family hydrolase
MKIQVEQLDMSVSAILEKPRGFKHLLLLAHGAGAGMEHPGMESLARMLYDNKIASLRFNFAYMELGKKAPDRPPKAIAVIKAAYEEARKLAKGKTLLAGGKSFGGRMTSTACSQGHLAEVKGLIFFGFPLHAPGRDSLDRAAHLHEVRQPMLFLQGAKDKLANMELMHELNGQLKKSRMRFFEHADHSFKVPKKSGRTSEEIHQLMSNEIQTWLDKSYRQAKPQLI